MSPRPHPTKPAHLTPPPPPASLHASSSVLIIALVSSFVAGAAVSWQLSRAPAQSSWPPLAVFSGRPPPQPPARPPRPTVAPDVAAELAHLAALAALRSSGGGGGGGACQLPPSHDPARSLPGSRSMPLSDVFGRTLNLESVRRPWSAGAPPEERFGPPPGVPELPPGELPSALDFLRDFVHLGRPLVLRGYARAQGWAAPTRWTDAYLRETVGSVVMPMRTSKFGDGVYHYAHGLSAAQNMPVADFIDRLNTSEAGRHYLAQGNLMGRGAPGTMGALLADIAPPPFAAALDLKHVQLWLGARDIKNPAHYDSNENIIVQISGEKTFTLFPPGARNFLEPKMYSEYSAPLTRMVDVSAVNETLYPCFAHARAMASEVTLRAGDAMYVPPYFWHAVHSRDAGDHRSLAVNFWYSVHSALLQQMFKALDHSMLLERGPDEWSEPPLQRQRVW